MDNVEIALDKRRLIVHARNMAKTFEDHATQAQHQGASRKVINSYRKTAKEWRGVALTYQEQYDAFISETAIQISDLRARRAVLHPRYANDVTPLLEDILQDCKDNLRILETQAHIQRITLQRATPELSDAIDEYEQTIEQLQAELEWRDSTDMHFYEEKQSHGA